MDDIARSNAVIRCTGGTAQSPPDELGPGNLRPIPDFSCSTSPLDAASGRKTLPSEIYAPTGFHSILFFHPAAGIPRETLEAPDFFSDLHLDQVMASITAGREEYNLLPFFYTALPDTDSIRYRQEIMQDLEDPGIFDLIKAFSEHMRIVRKYHAQGNELSCRLQKERWFLDAVDLYCEFVGCLERGFYAVEPESVGFREMRKYLTCYIGSERFSLLRSKAKQLLSDLKSIKYCVHINNSTVKVRKFKGEPDFSTEVLSVFEKFQEEAVTDYRVEFHDRPCMNHVETAILELVARLYPEVFGSLNAFYTENADYLDQTIAHFDREVQFYVAFIEYTGKLKKAGLQFCYPHVSDSKDVSGCEVFDLALAEKLVSEQAAVVCNDFFLRDPERIFVVTGPNQGGKTTFGRTFGQLHFLASLGLTVPGRTARLFLFDRLFTHFEREERIQSLKGKLQDDLVRIHDILEAATPRDIIVINEIFTSTTIRDAVLLGKRIMERLSDLDALCVFVTFLDELAVFSERTVSMVSTVVPENPSQRTFRVVRKPADGLSYALSIAEKYGVTYDSLKERLRS